MIDITPISIALIGARMCGTIYLQDKSSIQSQTFLYDSRCFFTTERSKGGSKATEGGLAETSSFFSPPRRLTLAQPGQTSKVAIRRTA